MKIESRDSDIESLLDSSYFSIPRFQRPYSWESEHIHDFWEDVVSNKSDDYFIGSMVVFKKEKQRFGVVDGQQRLTTITILLCVIRDKFIELGQDNLAQGVHQLIERKDRDNKDEFVLKTETSFPYFQDVIQNYFDPEVETDIREEEKALLNAYKLFQVLVNKHIKTNPEDEGLKEEDKNEKKIDILIELRGFVFNLKVIFVMLEDEDDAYLIFETLNTRGKDLALSDLVKNHFAKHMKSRSDVDATKLKWDKILETIHKSSEDISPDNFIYHFWASRYEAVPLKKLFKKFNKTVTKANARSYLDYMVEDSKNYRSLYEISYGWDKGEMEAARSLDALKIFKVTQPTPGTLSLVRAYRDKKIKYARLKMALQAIEKFHFQFTAITSSRSSGGISAMYSSFGQKLYRANGPQQAAAEIDDLIRKLRDKVPSRDEFVANFREVYFTNSNSKQKNLVRYILRSFSHFYKFSFQGDFEDLTIEHLLPQKAIDAQHPEELVGSLGNLLFVDEKTNNKLDTKPVAEKLEILNQLGHTVPPFILDAENWSSEEIEAHTVIMAGEAYDNIWRI